MTTCTRCILSDSDTKIIDFDKQGVCSYCGGYDQKIGAFYNQPISPSERLKIKVEEMKSDGKGKKYDCIVGISGGTDSSYLALWAYEQGLRPLVVHMDNGWNTEIAVNNIENICHKLGYDLHTHVINWEEFRDLQLAYLKASVVDIEVLTDHAVQAVIYNLARKYKIKYTLNGYNYATEAIMPNGWTYKKRDFVNIADIYSKFGSGRKLKTFPRTTFWKSLFNHWFLKLESIQVLNFIDYNKEKAQEIIKEKLGWRDHGGKHFESVFTKFYQVYILPKKFGIDKRKCHLSNLICSGQITREQALKELELPMYDERLFMEEKEFIFKKFGLSEDSFEAIMKLPVRLHTDFKTDQVYWDRYFKIVKFFRPLWSLFKRK